jgi:hypothetical protein
MKIRKFGTLFSIFLFGVVTFISGNLSQVNAASSSTVLPIAKGGTGSNSAAGARTNLNAQETLVSGTNIKNISNVSLLNSGNINVYTRSNATTMGSEQYTYFHIGYSSPIKTINNITFNLDERSIQFPMGIWQSAYLNTTGNDGNTKSFFAYTQNETATKKFSLPNYMSYSNGIIQTSNAGTILISVCCDAITGFKGRVERIA